MSTFREIIARVDEIKPNAFSESTKLNWLTSLNGKLAIDIFMMDIAEVRELPHGAGAMDCEPLVGFPHEEVYEEYLAAKIDAANGEASEYQNRMQIYDAYYTNFVSWFKATYDPVQGDPNCHGLKPKLPTYYITAYGLAVKLGYQGSLEEWLASLKGEPGFAPTVEVTEIKGGYRTHITDADKTSVFELLHGVPATISVRDIEGGHEITVTDVNGEVSFNVMNGTGAVSSVGGVMPDQDGNVPLTVGGVAPGAGGNIPISVRGVIPGENGDIPLTPEAIGAQKKHVARVVLLLADGWIDNMQTVEAESVTANNTLIVGSAPENYDAYSKAGVYCCAQSDRAVTFKCNSVPDTDLNANIVIWI